MKRRAILYILISLIFATAVVVAICLYFKTSKKPHVHKYVATVISPTCEDGGYTLFACACKDFYRAEEKDKTGHKFVNYISDNNATFYEDGTRTAICENNCGKSDTVTDVGSKLLSSLNFNTLIFENNSCFVKVSNSCAQFSFLSEISLVGDASFEVFSDSNLSQKVDLVAPLSVGKNVFYIKAKVSGNTDIYTLTVARKALFTVCFDLDCELTLQSVLVEEGDLLPEIILPERQGYKFIGWDCDLTKPVMDSFTAKATWLKIEQTDDEQIPENPPEEVYSTYTIEYYLEDVNGQFVLKESIFSQEEVVGKEVFAPQKDYPHFTAINKNVSATVEKGGGTVLKVYYSRNQYTVTFNGNGGSLISGEERQSVKYQKDALPPVYERVGYEFSGFSGAFNGVESDIEIKALWSEIDYKINYNLNGGTNSSGNVESYTINSGKITLSSPTYENFVFIGWFDENGNAVLEIESTMASDVTLTAMWESELFIIEGDTVKGLTEKGLMQRNLTLVGELNGVKIAKIAPRAFENSAITMITIPESIVYIGECAFSGSAVISVTFKDCKGWAVEYGEMLSSTLLSVSINAATLLKNTYCNNAWVKQS